MNRWNAHESSAPSYSVGGIGFKVLFLFTNFFLLLLLRFFTDRFFFLGLSESKLSDEELDSLNVELSEVSDEELSEEPVSDEVDELPDELSSVELSVSLVFRLLRVFLLGLTCLNARPK